MSEPRDLYDLFPGSAHQAAISAAFAPGALLSGDVSPIAQRPVVMVFTNRCGSTFIAAKLSEGGYVGSPTAHRNFEFFNADIMIPWCQERGIASLDGYVRAVAVAHAAPAGTFFTKVSLDQLIWLTRCGIIGTLLPEPIFVHVVRRDVVAQAISLVIAVQTGEWTSLHEKNPKTPDFMPNAIVNVAKDIRLQEAHAELYFSLTQAAVVRIFYEDAVADPEGIVPGFSMAAALPPVRMSHPTLPVERQAGRRNAEWQRLFQEFVAARMPVWGGS